MSSVLQILKKRVLLTEIHFEIYREGMGRRLIIKKGCQLVAQSGS